jgi:hypothetical protein
VSQIRDPAPAWDQEDARLVLEQAVATLEQQRPPEESEDQGMLRLFREWLWAARLDPGIVARIGGPETVALARLVAARK